MEVKFRIPHTHADSAAGVNTDMSSAAHTLVCVGIHVRVGLCACMCACAFFFFFLWSYMRARAQDKQRREYFIIKSLFSACSFLC